MEVILRQAVDNLGDVSFPPSSLCLHIDWQGIEKGRWPIDAPAQGCWGEDLKAVVSKECGNFYGHRQVALARHDGLNNF